MATPRVALVTGANKGIGFAIVRQLALQYPKSSFNNGPLLIYLTARDSERGEEALKELHQDQPLKEAKALQSDGGLTDVKYHQLDIASKNSIQDVASFLRREHPDGIDFVINNAGVAFSGFDLNVVKQTLEINYYGTLMATQEFLPLIKDGGRLVNVTSTAGKIVEVSEPILKRFQSAKAIDDITKLMEEYQTAVEEGTEEQKGWPKTAYHVSKAGANAITRLIAEKHAASGSKTLINACCPGYVKTDMTRGGGVKTPDDGAQTPVLLALGDIGQQNALFWRDEKAMEL